METWVWLGAYLVGFLLLQVYLYRYFTRRSRTDGTPAGGHASGDARSSGRTHVRTEPNGDRPNHAPDLGPPGDRSPEDVVRCQTCGSYNRHDRMFVYCRNCGERLD